MSWKPNVSLLVNLGQQEQCMVRWQIIKSFSQCVYHVTAWDLGVLCQRQNLQGRKATKLLLPKHMLGRLSVRIRYAMRYFLQGWGKKVGDVLILNRANWLHICGEVWHGPCRSCRKTHRACASAPFRQVTAVNTVSCLCLLLFWCCFLGLSNGRGCGPAS